MKKTIHTYLHKLIKNPQFQKLFNSLQTEIDFPLKASKNCIINGQPKLGKYSSFMVQNFKFIEIKENFECRRFCTFLVYGGSLSLGENLFMNNGCSINCLHEIVIGDNVQMGENIKIYDHNHEYQMEKGQLHVIRDQFSMGKVQIGNNCWIGSNVTILKGVSIGDNVIIGANCLIHKDIPANTIVKQKAELIFESLEK